MQKINFTIAEPIFVTIEFPAADGIFSTIDIDAAEVDSVLYEAQQSHGSASPESYRILRRWFAEKLGRPGDEERIGLNQVADLAELCTRAASVAAEERKKKLASIVCLRLSTQEYPATFENGADRKNEPGSTTSAE